MVLDCIFVDGMCRRCHVTVPESLRGRDLRRNCKGPPCPHLGPQKTNKEGVKIKVKCGCSKKHQEQQVPAHTCDVFKRCLPSVRFNQKQIEEWNQRDEAALYALCQLCPIKEG